MLIEAFVLLNFICVVVLKPKSPTQIVMALDAVEKDDLEAELLKLEEENR